MLQKMSSQSADVQIEQPWVIRYCVRRGVTVKQTLDEMERCMVRIF